MVAQSRYDPSDGTTEITGSEEENLPLTVSKANALLDPMVIVATEGVGELNHNNHGPYSDAISTKIQFEGTIRRLQFQFQ